MTKRIEAKTKICRRLGVNLWGRAKNPLARRDYAPGEHGQKRRKLSDYALQLAAKQKLKKYYANMTERQFRRAYETASRQRGDTAENLIALLERRLDNIAYRLGFAGDHAEARQLVRHGHFKVNGSRVNIPSYLVRMGDVIEVKEKSQKVTRIVDTLGAIDRRGVPQWLELDKDHFRGRVKAFPSREDFTLPIREQLIVELYSK